MEHFLKHFLTLVFLSLLCIQCKTLITNSSSIDSKIKGELDALLIDLNQNGKFNGNALVAVDNRIIYNKSFGFSNGEKNELLKITDRFNIGSIYKELPAIAIMQLERKKLLKLDDPIDKYIENLPSWSTDISILNLLQYTGGLPKVNWGKHNEINDANLLSDLSDISSLEFTPGEDYLYTNYSPFLLSKIVEIISNSRFSEYAEQNIFQPLNLTQSFFDTKFPTRNRDSMAIAFNGEFIEDNPPFTITTSLFLYSTTAQDLFKLLEGIHEYRLIDQKALITIGETADLTLEYMESALGQVEIENNLITTHSHHGSTGNYESIVDRNNTKSTTIVLLANSKNDNVHSIRDSIQALLNEYKF